MPSPCKFRIPSRTTINNILQKFTYDIDSFIYKISISYNKPIAYFNQCKCLVLQEFLKELKQKTSSIIYYNKTNLFKHIKILQEQFVITYVDKSPNNYVIICKECYYNHLNIIVSINNNFKISNESSVVKNRQIYSCHKLLKIPPTNFNYPYIVLIPKFHKNPISKNWM